MLRATGPIADVDPISDTLDGRGSSCIKDQGQQGFKIRNNFRGDNDTRDHARSATATGALLRLPVLASARRAYVAPECREGR